MLSYVCVGVQLLADMTDAHSYTQTAAEVESPKIQGKVTNTDPKKTL